MTINLHTTDFNFKISDYCTPQFNSQAVIRNFKKLLKQKGIEYTYVKNPGWLVVHDTFNIRIVPHEDGYFFAEALRWEGVSYTVTFYAFNQDVLIGKLFRFQLIKYNEVRKLLL